MAPCPRGTPTIKPYISLQHTGNTLGRPITKRLYLEHVDGFEQFLIGGTADGPVDFGPPTTEGAYYFVEYVSGAFNECVGDRPVRRPPIATRNILTGNRRYGRNRWDHYRRSALPVPRGEDDPQRGPVQKIGAAGDRIEVASELLLVSNTTGAAITLTSPVEGGEDGEFVTIMNVGTDDVLLQDQATSPQSNLRLVSSRVKLGPRHSIELVYLFSVRSDPTDRGDWVQVGNVVPVL